MGSRSNDTRNDTQQNYNDSRTVNDAGTGVIGSGSIDNSVDASQTTNWLQQISDNRSNSNSGNTSWAQTTTQTDSSSKSYENSGNTTWTSTVTDGGAIKGMTEIGLAQSKLAEQIARISSDNASMAASSALKAQENALSTARAANSESLDFAKGSQAQAFKSVGDMIGFANEGVSTMAKLTTSLIGSAQKQTDQAASTAAAAYSNAASQANGNKTLVIAALAAVAVVAAAVVFRKG